MVEQWTVECEIVRIDIHGSCVQITVEGFIFFYAFYPNKLPYYSLNNFFQRIPLVSLQVENECGEIPTVIVQNKIDLLDQAVVSP